MNALSSLTATTVAVDSTELKAAVAKLKPIIGRQYAPVLTCLMVDASADGVLLTATNLDDTLSIRLDGIVTEPGSLLVPFALVAKLLSVCGKGTVEFAGPATADGNGTLRSKNVTLEFDPIALSEWPTVSLGTGREVTLNLDAIADVLPAVSTDEARPILCSVLVDNGTYVGTNSHVLHLVSTGSDTGDSFLVQRDSLAIATKYTGSVSATVYDRHVTMRLDDRTTLISRLVEGSFPAYERLIPTEPPQRLEFTPDLVDTLKAVRKLDKTDTVRVFQQEPGVVAVRPYTDNLKATVTTPGTFVGKVDSIGFNPQYLLTVLTGTSSDVLLFTDQLKPAILREAAPECGDSTERIRLIMPVRMPA